MKSNYLLSDMISVLNAILFCKDEKVHLGVFSQHDFLNNTFVKSGKTSNEKIEEIKDIVIVNYSNQTWESFNVIDFLEIFQCEVRNIYHDALKLKLSLKSLEGERDD